MRILKNTIATILLLALYTTQSIAADGVIIKSSTKNLNSGKVFSTNIYITTDKVLIESKENGSFYFDNAKEEFGYIDHVKKEYYMFDRAAMQQLKQQVKMMVAMMKQFASPEQKKKLDKMLGSDASAASYQVVNKKAKVRKWNTTQYEGISDGSKVVDMYIASFSNLKVSKDDFSAMEKMIMYFKENLSEIVALLPAGGSFSQLGIDESSPIFREGVPVKTTSYKNGKADNENNVSSISKGKIDDAKFGIPQGYTRKEINLEQLGK